MSGWRSNAGLPDTSDRTGLVRQIGQPMCARPSGIVPPQSGFIPEPACRESV